MVAQEPPKLLGVGSNPARGASLWQKDTESSSLSEPAKLVYM